MDIDVVLCRKICKQNNFVLVEVDFKKGTVSILDNFKVRTFKYDEFIRMFKDNISEGNK